MIPLRDENPAGTMPVVTRVLIVLNCAAFLYELSLGPALKDFVMQWSLVPAHLTQALAFGLGPMLQSSVPILTSMFLHGGWLHLVGNMWYFAIFGDNIEDRLGSFVFLLFYLCSGFVAALLHWYFNPHSVLPSLGASGAIAGVLGAYLVAFPRARVITLVPLFPFFQIMALPASLILGLWFVYQFFSGFLSIAWSATRSAGGGVAWWAHVGGFVFGMLAMLLLGGGGRRASRAWAE